MDLFEKYKYKKSKFTELSFDDEKIIYGKLKMLEDLAIYIDTMRESLTRHLVVSGANECETLDDLKKRWKNVKGLDDDVESKKDDSDTESILSDGRPHADP